jgi:hypothetical protein
MMKLIISTLLSLLSSLAFAYEECNTHQICPLDQICNCTVPAYSNYNRFYYFDIPDLQKGHLYQCHISDSLGITMGVLGNSTFPAGSTWQLHSPTLHSPLNLTIDSTSQVNSSEELILKYFVPGSDMPTDVSGACTTLA